MTEDAIPNLVIGLGVTGRAVARALVQRGQSVVGTDDRPTGTTRTFAAEVGVDLYESPTSSEYAELVGRSSRVLPSPGIPDAHPAMVAARTEGAAVRSEFDLAAEWDDRPIVAITGTNGKTTVTTLVTEMIERGGRHAVAVGNTDLPLIAAIDDPTIDVFVVEASSFRIAHSHHFAPEVAVWLNFAPDHLDVHASLAAYEAAKAQLLRDQEPDAVAVLNADDPIVMSHTGPARRVTFSATSGDWRVAGRRLVSPAGDAVVSVDELRRGRPHDIANALAAAAAADAIGVDLPAIGAALRSFDGLPHRVQLVAEIDGVQWIDDSKATVPEAAAAAISGFDSVVLIAGGKGKGLDPAPLAADPQRLRAVVAIGDAAPSLVALFGAAGIEVVVADSMGQAVDAARSFARTGDVVLLSPGGASQDWYTDYAARGDDFAAHVRRLGTREVPT